MGYIDADKLKKLIDEKWKELADKNVKAGGGKWDAEISTYLSVLSLIDFLQQEMWKPSEEQIGALEDAKMRMSLIGYGLCPLLQTLINDLKSL